MVIIHPADKDTAMDTDVTAITAVMEATTEVMVNTELTVTMARWKRFDGQVWPCDQGLGDTDR